MEPQDVMTTRGRALEEAFFAEQDEILLKRLREAAAGMTRRLALAEASGIAEPAVLEELDTLGLTPRTVSALALVPLLLVAWADGVLDAREKAAVLDAAREHEIGARPEAIALLEGWLAAPPSAALARAWRDYAQALGARLSPQARAALAADTVARARRVAEAAGGFLGLGNRVSAAEEQALAGLAGAFG